jgi:hypothetical protein
MADITVQVSSAGLTAYGAGEWSSNTYGGDTTTSTTIGSLDAFNNEGWGRLSWNSLTWGQDFENQTVQVSTPGNPTTWGSDVWGDAEWGQITGMDTDLGTADLTVSVDASITGQQLNTTTNTAVAGASAEVTLTGVTQLQTFTGNEFAGPNIEVQVTSPANDEWGTEYWGAGQWGVGDGVTVILGQETISGDANVQVTGEQIAFQAVGETVIPIVIENGFELQSAQGDAFGGELVEVEVTTASAAPYGYGEFGSGQWGQGVGTDISIGGEEVAVPSVEVPVNNTNLTISTEVDPRDSVTITGTANISPTGSQLTPLLGDEDAVPNTIASPTGIEISFVLQGVVAGSSVEVDPTGVTMTPTTGTIGLNAWELVDPGTAPTWTVVDKAA